MGKDSYLILAGILTMYSIPVLAQTRAPKDPSAVKPTGQQPPQAQAAIPSPVSKHYPILIIAHGNEPSWALRVGMKGPERLDRLGYPPVVLEPAEVLRDDSGNFWTYNAKDFATGAAVAVKLTRETCSDNLSDIKYTFQVEVNHAQIGPLKGCGRAEPDKFPEFRKKNQLEMPEDETNAADKDKDKKTVLDPITKIAPPVAVAYLDAAGRVIVGRGAVHKIAASAGTELALSHDGKKLLFTRADSRSGPERSIVLHDFDTGRSGDIVGPAARQASWSPDDSRIAFLKYDGKLWQVWTAPVAMLEKAAPLSAQPVDALHGWITPTTVLASDLKNAYWLSEDKPSPSVPLKDIYGPDFQVMSGDTIRVCPINPDLLLVTAYYLHAPAGSPTDAMGLNETFFLYEVRSHRRTILGPPDAFARNAEWSRDGLQIFFTRGVPGKGPLVTNRIFWDGTGDKRYAAGINFVVGK